MVCFLLKNLGNWVRTRNFILRMFSVIYRVDADLSCSDDSDLDSDDDCEKATKNVNTVKPIQKLEKCETVTSANC